MNHRRISTLLLAAGAIAIAGVLWVFGLAVPAAADRCQRLFSGVSWLYWPALVYVWAVGVLMLCAIVQYMRICLRIGRDRSFSEENARRLQGVVVKISAKAGSAGKLFGAVTSKEISDALKEQFDIDIEKNKIVQAEPIKNYGSYEDKCKLGHEVSAVIHVMVVEAK